MWFHRRERRRICGFVHTSAFMPFLRGQNVVCFDKNLMFFKDSYDSFHSMCAVKLNTSLPLFFLTSASDQSGSFSHSLDRGGSCLCVGAKRCHHSPRGAKEEPDGTDERQ
jgi:hypothetical protein